MTSLPFWVNLRGSLALRISHRQHSKRERLASLAALDERLADGLLRMPHRFYPNPLSRRWKNGCVSSNLLLD